MFARLLAARKDEEGFTLIELLVVIIIIGILAAIAIPVFLNQRASAAKAALTSDARNGAVQIETYFTDNQAYPDDVITSGVPGAGEVLVELSTNSTVGAYTGSGTSTSYTYCVLAVGGAADGWGVTYDSSAAGVGAPDPDGC